MKNHRTQINGKETSGLPDQHDSLALLRIYMPDFYECLIGNTKNTKAAISKYNERWRSMEESVSKTGYFSASTCIYDLLWQASENDMYAVVFLGYMNEIIKSVLNVVKGDRRKEVESLLIKMLANFSNNNSEYKNHFAELAVLYKLTKDGSVTLRKIEKELPNNASIDFEFERESTVYLAEVYNINFDIQKITCSKDLIEFLETRLTNKLNDKLKNMEHLPPGFMLAPVLWGDIVGLDKFRSSFDYFKDFKFILPFMVFAQFKNANSGEVIYEFMTMDSLFERRDKITSI